MSISAELSNVQSDQINQWYGAATVRRSDRIKVPGIARNEHIFPRSRQPVSEHPLVVSKGASVVHFVLAQCAYRYMYVISMLETKFVIDCALKIVNGEVCPGATDLEKINAIAIVIDEGYHAHVALDFIMQMKKLGVAPIEVPRSNENLDAVRRAYLQLPEFAHRDFELISVCLAEHTLTKDLLAIGKEKDATVTFTRVMTDHVSDEGRHAGFFADLMKARWSKMPEATKRVIGEMLPAYLDDYLAYDNERIFEQKVLGAAGLSEEEVTKVLEETATQYHTKANDYVTTTKANLIRLLRRAGILDHPPTQAAFISHGQPLPS